jgi:hypothetical protein
MLNDTHRRSASRFVWTLVLGLFLGGLFTKLAETLMWDGAPRDFFTTSVAASVGPFSIDLVAVAFTIGPLVFTLNVLTLVGIAIVAFVVRSWM